MLNDPGKASDFHRILILQTIAVPSRLQTFDTLGKMADSFQRVTPTFIVPFAIAAIALIGSIALLLLTRKAIMARGAKTA